MSVLLLSTMPAARGSDVPTVLELTQLLRRSVEKNRKLTRQLESLRANQTRIEGLVKENQAMIKQGYEELLDQQSERRFEESDKYQRLRKKLFEEKVCSLEPPSKDHSKESADVNQDGLEPPKSGVKQHEVPELEDYGWYQPKEPTMIQDLLEIISPRFSKPRMVKIGDHIFNLLQVFEPTGMVNGNQTPVQLAAEKVDGKWTGRYNVRTLLHHRVSGHVYPVTFFTLRRDLFANARPDILYFVQSSGSKLPFLDESKWANEKWLELTSSR